MQRDPLERIIGFRRLTRPMVPEALRRRRSLFATRLEKILKQRIRGLTRQIRGYLHRSENQLLLREIEVLVNEEIEKIPKLGSELIEPLQLQADAIDVRDPIKLPAGLRQAAGRVLIELRIRQQLNKLPWLCPSVTVPEAEALASKWKCFLQRTYKSTAPVEYGPGLKKSTVQIFDEPEQCFNHMWESIDSSAHRVWLENYIFDNSATTGVFVQKLCNAARRGVDVVVLLDSIGSLSFSRRWRELLKKSGVNLVFFNSLTRPCGPWFFRNHKKVLICDNDAYCGSMNCDRRSFRLSEQKALKYLGDNIEVFHMNKWPSTLLTKFFEHVNIPRRLLVGTLRYLLPHFTTNGSMKSDYNLQVHLQGGAVTDLSYLFCETLRESRHSVVRFPSSPPSTVKSRNRKENEPPIFDGCFVQVLQSNCGRIPIGCIQPILSEAVSKASRSLIVMSSYFHPPGFLRRALLKPLRAGVPTQLVLSGKSDVTFDHSASLAILPYLLLGRRNIGRAFFTRERHCHAKATVVDGLYSCISSFNWDRYSSRRNLEAGVAIFSSDVASYITKRQARLLLDEKASDKAQSAVLKEKKAWEYSVADALLSRPWTRISCWASYHMIKWTGGPFFDRFGNVRRNLEETAEFVGKAVQK